MLKNHMESCLFCNSNASVRKEGPFNERIKFICPICSEYYVSDIIYDRDRDTVNNYAPYKHLISGLLFERKICGLKTEPITTVNIHSMQNDPLIPKTLMQKLDKIILFYYKIASEFGESFDINKTSRAVGYAKTDEEFGCMINALDELGYLYNQDGVIQLTYKGMEKAEQMLTTNIASKKVFVAMGFKNDLLEAHIQAIKPACNVCGFDAFIVSEVLHNGDITDRIIAEIKTSKFMIADLTYNNSGAYFEAGYAQGKGLEVIRTCKKEWFDEVDENGMRINHLHFDVDHYSFILWKDYEDLKEQLVNKIRATIL